MWYRVPALRMVKASGICLLLFLLCIALIGCSSNISADSSSAGGSGFTNNDASSIGAQGVQIFVEPNAGVTVITNAIVGAKKTILLEMYLLTERKVINALEDAARRGVDVQVMLEQHPYGGGSPTQTIDRLRAAGIRAQNTNPAFALTHEKGMVIDDHTAYIMTANFTLSALGGSSYTTNREYGIIDTNIQDVQAVTTIFNADWKRTTPQIHAPNIVLSPINARSTFTTLINSARKTLLIEAEEMQDSSIERAIVNAGQRGVLVQIILPAPNNSSSEDSNSIGIRAISHTSIKIEEDSHLYMHAKIIIVDSQRAFVGSENISTASLERNRELGILVSDQNVLDTLQQTFQQDWTNSA